MSFSSDIKKELSDERNRRRHCQIAEFAAIQRFGGRILEKTQSRFTILLQSENIYAARKYNALLKRCFHIKADVSARLYSPSKETMLYTVLVSGQEDCMRILQTLKLYNLYNIPTTDASGGTAGSHSAASGDIADSHSAASGGTIAANSDILVNPLLIQNTCCRRAFLRGAFLAAGSMSDPRKSYHIEIVCDTSDMAKQLQLIMHNLSLNAKIVSRKKQFVVYLKEGSQIVDMLNTMEAHVSLMEFENIRIVRDIANHVNRQTNCDVANSQKTVNASARQREDILLIEKERGLSSLPEGLQEIALIRLENPDMPIKDLGQLLSPPLGKSGVNHRLRKIGQIADEIRGT